MFKLISLIFAAHFLSVCLIGAQQQQQAPRVFDIGRGYIVGEIPVSHNEAKNLCEFAGKVLVSIETLEEDKLIFDMLKTVPQVSQYALWTSGKNSVGPRTWQWGNGAPFFHTRWQSGRPFFDNNNYCLVIAWDVSDRAWDSYPCDTLFYPFCESKGQAIKE